MTEPIEPLEDLEAQLRKRLIILHVNDETGEVHLDHECSYAPHELIGWAAYLETLGHFELGQSFDE